MARSNVFVRAGNDYRETSVGGRRNSNKGWSWINFDWFRGHWTTRPDKRFKNPEIAPKITEFVTDVKGTSSISTEVCRHKNGSVEARVIIRGTEDVPNGLFDLMVDIDGKVLCLDVHDFTKYAKSVARFSPGK